MDHDGVTPADNAELSHRQRYLVLAICCMSLFVVGIDVSGVNLALPQISHDLGASLSQLQWVVDAYTLVLASLLMLAGSVADRVGRRRIFQIGLTVFGIGSLLCSVAPSSGFLIGARMVQAVGGSMMNPVAMSIIVNTFHDLKERAQAIGMWSATIGLSMALGPVVGGALVDSISWRAIFWINLPIVLAGVVLTQMFVPESRAPRARRFDPAGQLLVTLSLGALTYAIIEGRDLGCGSDMVIGCLLVAVVAILLFVLVELCSDEPLLDPRLFRSVPFSGAVLSAILGFGANGGFLLINTLYLQEVRGLTPFHAGLMTLPMAVCTALFSPLSGRLVGSVGTRIPQLLAGVGILCSSIILGRLTDVTALWVLGLAYAAFGFGFGMLNAPITSSAVSGLPRDQAGVASAVASTSRQIGTSLGVAVFGSVVFAQVSGPVRADLAAASHVGWLIMSGCAIGLMVLALVTSSAWAHRTRVRTEELAAARS